MRAAAAACSFLLLLCCMCNIPSDPYGSKIAYLWPWNMLSPLLAQFGAKSCWFSGDNFLWYAV